MVYEFINVHLFSQATFGTISLGSMQTYYNNKLLQPNENPYGVPNVGVYTLPGAMTTLADANGMRMGLSFPKGIPINCFGVFRLIDFCNMIHRMFLTGIGPENFQRLTEWITTLSGPFRAVKMIYIIFT